MIKTIDNHGNRVLVIGKSAPLLEGVADLLKVVGYPVDVSSRWSEAESAMYNRPPGLVIIDLSLAADDVYRSAEQIHGLPNWSEVPILFLSFSGDDRIRDLQSRGNGDKRVHFYAHSLLGIDRLLETVHACMA